MIEIDGIIYAKNPSEELIRVSVVKPTEDYKLFLTFTNGIQRVYDVKKLLDKNVYKCLADKELFSTAHVEHGTVVWNDDLDIDPDELYKNSVSIVEIQVMA